jgi:hypothetical protein
VALLAAAAPAGAGKVRVCVIAILATEDNAQVDRRLECIAREVQKSNPKLTGFRLAQMSCQSLAVGVREDFKLVEDHVAGVAVLKAADKDNCIQVQVTPPLMGDITYATACGKFLPILTPVRTRANEVLIIGVRVTPCPGK